MRIASHCFVQYDSFAFENVLVNGLQFQFINIIIKRVIHGRPARETLESVSSCTRFSGFLAISKFGFNRLNSKLVGMLFGIVPMFASKDFVPDCFFAQICANSGAHAHFGAYLRDEAIPNKIL